MESGSRVTALRRALTHSSLTAASAATLAEDAVDDASSVVRELGAALLWASAHLSSAAQDGTRSRVGLFSQLCVLATDGESASVRRTALLLLATMPSVPKELVEAVINKRHAFPVASAMAANKRKRSDPLEDDAAAIDVDELVVGWRSDAERRADAAAAAARLRAGAGFPDPPPDEKAMREEEVGGTVQLGLEDEHPEVRYTAVGALCALVWPRGPMVAPCTAPARAVGLLLDSCNDEAARVREVAMQQLTGLGPRLRLKASQIGIIGMNACDRMNDACARTALGLLGTLRLRDAPALTALQTHLANALRARPADAPHAERVHGTARAVGERHASLVLGRALVGLSRQAQRCDALTTDRVVATFGNDVEHLNREHERRGWLPAVRPSQPEHAGHPWGLFQRPGPSPDRVLKKSLREVTSYFVKSRPWADTSRVDPRISQVSRR